jgi:hypothetical protein
LRHLIERTSVEFSIRPKVPEHVETEGLSKQRGCRLIAAARAGAPREALLVLLGCGSNSGCASRRRSAPIQDLTEQAR